MSPSAVHVPPVALTRAGLRTRRRDVRSFRPDIQALRALAVALVVLFHLFPGRIPGGFVGVDVFFVISGFLITGHLVRDSARTGGIRLGGFWIRRIRRLIPAAFLVLATTVVAVLVLVPSSLWRQFLSEAAASALYAENWLLAANSVDYFAAEQLGSPVQHYWSLSVEEQFYLVWPVLLLLLTLAARRWGRSQQRLLIVGMAVVGAASLAYSSSVSSAPFAYFSTFTHAWEFAAGGLLALAGASLGSWFAVRPVLGSLATWTGIAAIVASAFLFTGATPFPGTAALLPVAGALLIVGSGAPRRAVGPDRLLAVRPVQWVGDVSYSLYLWHWPLIVVVPIVLGHPLRLVDKLSILAAALVLAALTKRYVEDRLRAPAARTTARPWRPLVALAASTAVIVGACLAAIGVLQDQSVAAEASVAQQLGKACFGADAMLDRRCDPGHTVGEGLGPAFAKDDTPIEWAGQRYDDCPIEDGIRQCDFGPAGAAVTVAMVGDSHVRQYLPALSDIAKEKGWRLKLVWSAGCRPIPPTYATVVKTEQTADCRRWKERIGPVIAADPSIDLVVTSGATRRFATLMPEQSTQRAMVAGLRDLWSEWASAGKRVIVIPDNAIAPVSVPDCIANSDAVEDPCALPRAEALPPDPIDRALAEGGQSGVGVLDLSGSQCDSRSCHFVVGGVITNYDSGHLSTTFVRSLESTLEGALVAALAERGP